MNQSAPAARRALITGITGQDGSYLAEFLLGKGYQVWGIARKIDPARMPWVEELSRDAETRSRLHLEEGDLRDRVFLGALIRRVDPDETYNLAGQSHVGRSYRDPITTADTVHLGALRLLEAFRRFAPGGGFFQASSAEMFAPPRGSLQNEETPFEPRSPYGTAKLAAHLTVRNARERDGLFACSGILFNHESPRRGEDFVTRKITKAVAEIHLGRREKLTLGNLDARRDWGFAGDYVRAMWLMLRQDRPEDLVIASGESHSVREFLATAFGRVGLDWQKHVTQDPALLRPEEIETVPGDASRARNTLGWSPEVNFDRLVGMMVDADVARLSGRPPHRVN